MTEETAIELIRLSKQDTQIKILTKLFNFELGCGEYISPREYEKKYNLEMGSNLAWLLESYHQLRLRDEKVL